MVITPANGIFAPHGAPPNHKLTKIRKSYLEKKTILNFNDAQNNI